MTEPSTAAAASPAPYRIDPSPSKVFVWLEWLPAAPALTDDLGRTVRPAGPCLHVCYRYNGAVWEFWPVSEEEWRRLASPGPEHGYSIGSAFSQIIKARKSGRLVKAGDGAGAAAGKPASPEAKELKSKRWLA